MDPCPPLLNELGRLAIGGVGSSAQGIELIAKVLLGVQLACNVNERGVNHLGVEPHAKKAQ